SSSKVSHDQTSNSTSKGRIRRSSKQKVENSNFEENPLPPPVPMAENQTMAQLLQAPTDGYEDAIVIPEIAANNFELKHGLINLFFPPSKTTNLKNEITRFQQRFDESFYEAWDRFNDLLRACPHHGFFELHQLDTFYNAPNVNDQDSLNSVAGGNFLDKMPDDCLKIIERKSKVRQTRAKAVVAKVSSNSSTPAVSADVVELKDMLSPSKHEQDLPSTSSAPIIEDWVSDSKEEDIAKVTKDVPILAQSPELVKTPRYSGLISPPPMSVAPPVPLRLHSPLKGLRRSKKTCFVCKSETHLIKDCDIHARKLAQNSYASRDIHKHNAQMKYSRIPLHKVSATAPSKSQPVLNTAARTIHAVKPTFSKARPNIAPYDVSKSTSPFRKPFIRHTSPKPSISPPRVNAANPSAVSAGRVNAAKLSVVSAARINAIKPSTVTAVQHNHTKKGNPQQALKDKGVSDSGCSKHMTGNMSYLSDFEELNRGYVAFGGNPKGGKITGKGKIKTGKLDFDDVYFVKELKFNLFSVSQMCDKKNNVLFTGTACLVLSSDFKLPDASQVLLRVPRENNMYNVNLKNIVGNKMHKAFPLLGERFHWQYKFPLPVEGVPTAKRMEIPLPRVCTAMMKKLPVKENWQLH
nr:ribonuclease H-like domain-containing protein [Tanacetum cinerariifolium]